MTTVGDQEYRVGWSCVKSDHECREGWSCVQIMSIYIQKDDLEVTMGVEMGDHE